MFPRSSAAWGFLVLCVLLQLAPGAGAQVRHPSHASPPTPVNRPPVVTSSLSQNAPLLEDGPFPRIVSAPMHFEDDLAFLVLVSDPDGDPVSLAIAEPFQTLRVEKIGGTSHQALFQVRLRDVERNNSSSRIAPERIVLVARDSGSPPAAVTFVQELRYREFWGDSLMAKTSYEAPQVAVGDVTGDGTPDVLHRVQQFPNDRILVHPGEDLAGMPTVLDLPSTGNAIGIRLRDLTGDGILDITCLNVFNGVRVRVVPGGAHLASGNPSSYTLSPTLFGTDAHLEFADVTGDGVIDVVLGTSTDTVNNTDNRVAVWKGPLPGPGSSSPAPLVVAQWDRKLEAPRLADATGDGILDILVGSREDDEATGLSSTGNVLVYPGGPSIPPQPFCRLLDLAGNSGDRLGEDVFVAEVTGDGIPDVVCSSRNVSFPGVLYAGLVYVWAGPLTSGILDVTARLMSPSPAVQGQLHVTGIADVTGDAIPDLLASELPDKTMIFAGGAALVGNRTPDATVPCWSCSPRDINGDFVPDLFSPLAFFAGGPGLVATANPAPYATLDPAGFNLRFPYVRGDVTGDGTLDFLWPSAEGPILLFPGAGTHAGSVPVAATLLPPAEAGYARDIELIDVSGDGILDVVGNYYAATVDGVSAAGETLVWNGGPPLVGSRDPAATLARAVPSPSDFLGWDGVWLEDIDGDGVHDVLPTGQKVDVNGAFNQGENDLFLGGPDLVGRVPAAAALTVVGQLNSELSAIADLDGDGWMELIVRTRPAGYAGLFVWSDAASNPGAPQHVLDDVP